MTINKFNIRIYGLFLNEENKILISDEFRLGMKMTKFPGGGLEFGEGSIDCLQREAIEEFGQEICDIEHFYTSDFFQQSYYFTDSQLISIYYFFKFKEKIKFPVSEKPFDFFGNIDGAQSFRFLSLQELKLTDFSFPIDRKVAELLISHL
ncbi:MAG: NUDIX domain-containing protein [Bacteroidetes bacterium]|nr:NUDIX domain-containing protein [Bacteroidota bacterium]MBT6686524.1 NUDIX domain-containing protein [Bacteroidota bacterium]MBT7143419.1 NUDIX domain-containing protein [Bacteroidota bacterium]MBT7493529.1 NUDIX domain-containing protein [Bacteroidota bacterium]